MYLLDHLAAAYVDTLHEAVIDESDEKGLPALDFLGEVKLPTAVVWVEFDDRALGVARFERASAVTRFDDKPLGKGLRGFLLDARNEAHLRVTMFHKSHDKGIIDPMFALLVQRSASGKLDFDNVEVEPSKSMVDFYMRTGASPDEIDGRRSVQVFEAGYDLFIPYALFAMLVSPDLGGIIPAETDTFTPRDIKTARKFNKRWILGAQKSHLTIRIGPQAAAHMAERTARLEFQREMVETRNGPVRHWVSQHERHYRNGKVVLVKGHHRGNELAQNLPTRVMGPKLERTRFEFPTTEPPNHD